MKKFNFDVAWDESTETFAGALEELAKNVKSALVRVDKAVGSGGGWPDVVVMVNDEDVEALMEWYGFEGDADEFEEIYGMYN